MRSLRRRESGQHILHVFKRIDAETLASLDEAHDGGSGMSAFLGACEKPVTTVMPRFA